MATTLETQSKQRMALRVRSAHLAMSSSRGLQPLRRIALKNICSDGYTHVPPAQKNLLNRQPRARDVLARTPEPSAW